MEAKWGIDRLESLVSAETAGKFGAALTRLNSIVLDEDAAITLGKEIGKGQGRRTPPERAADAIVWAAGIVQRGWLALDKEATELGRDPLPNGVWDAVDDNGKRFLVCLTPSQAANYRTHVKDGTTVVTVEELVRVWSGVADGLLVAAAEEFPGAVVQEVRKTTVPEVLPDDPIPFGEPEEPDSLFERMVTH